jgi:hypothetical protein
LSFVGVANVAARIVLIDRVEDLVYFVSILRRTGSFAGRISPEKPGIFGKIVPSAGDDHLCAFPNRVVFYYSVFEIVRTSSQPRPK